MTSPLRHVRLVATDLDGTLLRSDGSLSHRTRTAVRPSQDAGLSFAFLTARPLRGTRDLLLDAGFQGALATSNGAVCIDLVTGRHLYEPRSLPPAVVGSLVGWSATIDERCVIAIDTGDRVVSTGDLGDPGWPYAVVRRSSLPVQAAAPKVLVRPHVSVAEFLERIHPLATDLATVTTSTSWLVELGPPRTDKGRALRAVARHVGVPLREVLAVGDMPNDMPMLVIAGHAATPANGHASLRDLPDVLVTRPNDDDGVAALLAVILGERESEARGMVRRASLHRSADDE